MANNTGRQCSKSSTESTKIACNTRMLDVRWIYGETADKIERSYGDLMVIVDDAPPEVIETDFVKACIDKEWKV